MIPKLAIERAIEGGYGQGEAPYSTNWSGMALDPAFWRALGKSLYKQNPKQWQDVAFTMHVGHRDGLPSKTPKKIHRQDWLRHAHRFYDITLQGKDTTDYWNDILRL